MKKLLLILSCCLLFFSCGKPDSVEISKEEYAKLKGVNSEYPKPFELYDEKVERYSNAIILGSDNHEYLVIDYSPYAQTIEHYIDCKFCAKRN